jgi:hypothetical protein
MNIGNSTRIDVNVEGEARKLGMIYPSEAKVLPTEPLGE